MTNTSTQQHGPLAGIRVLELGQYISGPYAAKVLADLGAEVIKIETPEGDPMRRWEGRAQMSPQFAAYNRGKSSVVLDLKSEQGVEALYRLIDDADVLLDNFRPGVMARLGIGPDEVRVRNPRVITCSITGFGTTGPYSKRPAYDTVISAVGGMYSQVVPAETVRPMGPAFSDLLSGMSAAQAILAALHARNTSGVGEHVEVSMVGALVDFLTESASTFLEAGQISLPDSRPRRAQAYACRASDGKAFVIHMSVPEKFWTGLLRVLDREDLAADPRFDTREKRVQNYDELDVVLKEITATKPRDYWLERLADHDIPHGPLNSMGDLFDDPQVQSMALVEEIDGPDGPVQVPAPATKFHRSGRPELRYAPGLGSDTHSLTGLVSVSLPEESRA